MITKSRLAIALCVLILFIVLYQLRDTALFSSFVGPQKIDDLSILTAETTAAEIVGMVIEKYDLDAKHGLNLTVTAQKPGDMERRYLNGEFPVMNLGVNTAAAAYKQDKPTVIIGPGLLMTYHIAVLKDSPIHSLSDLRGKVFGVLPKATAAYATLATVLRSAGIDASKDMTLSFGSVPELNQRLLNGEVDAAIVSYPLGASLFASGKVRSVANLEKVWEENENGLPLPLAVISARKEWYEKNKDVAKKFVATWREAQQMIAEDPTIIRQFPEYLSANRLSSPEALKLLEQTVPGLLMQSFGRREANGIQRFFERSVEYGFVPSTTTPPEVLR